MKKIIIVVIIATILIIPALFILPTIGADIIPTEFGNMRVEIITKDTDGVEKTLSPTSIRTMEWMQGTTEVAEVEVKVYVTCVGSYENVEFDVSEQGPPTGYGAPKINANLQSGSSSYQLDSYYQGANTITVPTGEEILFYSATFQLDDYFIYFNEDNDLSGTIEFVFVYRECKYRGLPNGEWQTEDVSFVVDSGISLEWNAEVASCGDTSCEDEPYPGENCWSCPDDCDVCDAHIYPSDRTIYAYDGLGEDSWGIQCDWYDGEAGSWNGWSGSNTNWNHVEVYRYGDAFCTFAYYDASMVGSYLAGICEVKAPGGQWYELKESTHTQVGEMLTTEQAGPNNGMRLQWYTDNKEDHDLTANVDYEMRVTMWLTGEPNPNMHTLTVVPENAIDERCKVSIHQYPGNLLEDTTQPYTFQLAEGQNYALNVDWYGNEEIITGNEITSMPDSDTVINIEHPNWWLIKIIGYPYTTYYDFCVDWWIAEDECFNNVFGLTGAEFYRPNDLYQATGRISGDPSSEKTQLIDVTDSDRIIVWSFSGGSPFSSSGSFMISDTDYADIVESVPTTGGGAWVQ